MSEENIYSLLLNKSLILKNKEVIKYILETSPHKNILTFVDDTNFSPISRTLYSGSKEILQLMKDFIEKNKSEITKVDLIGDDYNNIRNILEFSQFEDLTVEKCIEEYLKPLYSIESITKIEEELLGEENNNVVEEHISFSSSEEELFVNDADLQDYCSSVSVNGDIGPKEPDLG